MRFPQFHLQQKNEEKSPLKHGPFDIRGGGGLFFIFEKKILALILAETRAPRGTDRSPEYNEYFCIS